MNKAIILDLSKQRSILARKKLAGAAARVGRRKWRRIRRIKAAILIQTKQRSILARQELAKRKVLREAEEDEMYLQSIIDARYRHLIEQKKMSLQ